MGEAVVKLRVFGDPAAEINGRSVGPDATHVFAALLLLALQPQHRVTRQRLGALLWPDAPANRRAARVRWLLNKIRALGVPIDASTVDVALARSVVEIDYVALLTDLDLATPERVLQKLGDIDAVLRDYAPDFSDALVRWVEEQRESIGDEILRRVVQLLVEARRNGNWDATDRAARAIRRVSPLHEEATLALAEALCAAGDKAHGVKILDDYLKEIGEESSLRLPAELLRRRVNARPDSSEETSRVRFVGRREQTKRFQSMLADASRGRGGILLFCGTAGIGKTRLLEECTAFASTVGQACIVRARCQPGDALRPLSGLTDVIPTLLETPGAAGCDPGNIALLSQLGEIDEIDSDDASNRRGNRGLPIAFHREEISDAVVDLLAAVSHERALIIQIDDFQWADTSLGWLWENVLPRTSNHRVLWCFAARVDQPDHAESLFSVLVQPLITQEWLRGLEPNDARSLLEGQLSQGRAATASVREVLLDRGGGIPLVLLELAQHWQAGGDLASVPRTLAALMDARLARLIPAARRTLQVSAVLGTFSTLERLERVLQLRRAEFVDALAQLESAGILATDAAGVTHGHVLWSEASLAHVEPSVLQTLHRHVAEQFDSELEAAASAVFLWESARHWEAAGQTERALGAIVRSAEHLARNGLYVEAAEVYQRAIDRTSVAIQRPAYIKRRIELFRLAGLWAPVAAEIDRYEEVMAAIGAREERHNELEFLKRHALFQTTASSASMAEDSLACAMDEGASTSHRLQASWDCIRYGWETDRRDVEERGYRILTTLIPSAPDDRQPYALGEIMFNVRYGDPRRAAAIASEWLQFEREQGDPYKISWSARMVGFTAKLVGDLPRARSACLESIRVARDARLSFMMFAGHDMHLGLMIEYDEPSVARQALESAWSECEPFADLVPIVDFAFSLHRAEIALEEGNAVEALRALPARAVAEVRTGRPIALHVELGAYLLTRASDGDIAKAHRLADELHGHLTKPSIGLGMPAATYAQYLDRYHGAEAADAFVRRFTTTFQRELLPPRRLAPFVARLCAKRSHAIAPAS